MQSNSNKKQKKDDQKDKSNRLVKKVLNEGNATRDFSDDTVAPTPTSEPSSSSSKSSVFATVKANKGNNNGKGQQLQFYDPENKKREETLQILDQIQRKREMKKT